MFDLFKQGVAETPCVIGGLQLSSPWPRVLAPSLGQATLASSEMTLARRTRLGRGYGQGANRALDNAAALKGLDKPLMPGDRAARPCRFFAPELSIIVHNFMHQVLDQLLSHPAVLLAS